ncbi:MAG: ATP-binding cassette domain-containing protein [Campylobacter sp.]|nr:ATP-binding cassette domain-containing protein [Campylobacter sp.]
MQILKGVNLTHKYDYTLFEEINFGLDLHESASIVGVSGCGKSTLLHILCSLLEPNSGEVFYKDKSIYKLSKDERVRICRLDFGIIFQSHYLFKGFSGIENIELATLLAGTKLDYELYEKLKITEVLKNKIGDLSGGQQQRISIARVLSKKPRIIFADEPTGNLDKTTASDVMSVIFEYIKDSEASLVLVTHDENIAKSCHSSYVLKDKKLNKF